MTCLIVSDDTSLATAAAAGLDALGVPSAGVGNWQPFDAAAARLPDSFDMVEATLRRAEKAVGPVNTIIVTLGHRDPADPAAPDWRQLLDGHRTVSAGVIRHAAWTRATARFAITVGRAMRVVHAVRALDPAARTAAQAVTQLARSAQDTPAEPAAAVFAVTIESADPADARPFGQLAARLAGAEDSLALAGAELVVGRGWAGVRGHPVPAWTVSFGGPEIPDWFNGALRQLVT